MGIVKKQGIANSVWLYLGLVLGYVNMGLIMVKLLSTENLGLRQVIFQAGDFFSVIALVGLTNVVNRFFPTFMDKEKGHGGILNFIFLYWLAGVAFTSSLMLIFKPLIVGFYEDKSQLLVDFYFYIIPFGAALALYEALSTYSKSLLKTTVPVFIREVAQRIITTLLLAMVYLKWMNFDDFMTWYLVSYIVATIALVIYLIKLGEFYMPIKNGFIWASRVKEMVVFGLYTWFNNAMQIIVKTADVLMLATYDLKKAGIYGLGSLIGNFVQVPSQSLRQIAAPLVSRYFEENNMKEIGDLYRKTCMVQLISGLFLYLIILANIDVLFTIWRSEFASAKVVIVYLGAARLIAGSTGLNGRIIVESKYFRLNFISNLLMGVLAVGTNMIFIPLYGIPGAAFASALTILLVSGIKVWFVYRKFGLQPFEYKTLWAIGIGLVAFFAANYIPQTGIFFLDIAIRSTIFSIIYIPLMLRFNLSQGINDMVLGGIKRVKSLVGKSQ